MHLVNKLLVTPATTHRADNVMAVPEGWLGEVLLLELGLVNYGVSRVLQDLTCDLPVVTHGV